MLRLINVEKKYNKNIVALNNINLELPDTGLVFLRGDSGAGKSTILNIISTLEMPTNGHLEFNGRVLDKSNIQEYLERNVSILFQDVNLFDDLSVIDNLSVYDASEEAVIEMLKLLDIVELKDKKVRNLSGGEKRRVAIARAIFKQPQILLCDEPEASLDEENREIIFCLLKNLSEKMLVIVTSHDAEIEDYADRIITVQNGNIVEDVVVSEVANNNLYLGSKLSISKKFIGRVSRDILFSKKVSFVIVSLVFSIFATLILLGGILSKYDYVDILVDTMKHENSNVILGTGNKTRSFVVGEDVYVSPNGESYSYGNKYLNLNICNNDEENVYDVYYQIPNESEFILYNDDFLTGGLIGRKPIEDDEIVIYEILALVINHYGIYLEDGSVYKGNDIENLIGKKVMMGELSVTISGIIKQDLDKFKDFKNPSYYDINEVNIYKNVRYFLFNNLIGLFRNMILVQDGFFSYIEGHYEKEDLDSSTLIDFQNDYNKVRKHLLTINPKERTDINLYKSLLDEGDFGDLELGGTLYAGSTCILYIFYLIGQIIILFSPVILVIMVYTVMMYFENIYKKNRQKYAILISLGLTRKDMNRVYLKSILTFYGVVVCISLIFVCAILTLLNINLSKFVGFYLHPFSFNVVYISISILVLVLSFVLSYLFLKLRVRKRQNIMYLKNN